MLRNSTKAGNTSALAKQANFPLNTSTIVNSISYMCLGITKGGFRRRALLALYSTRINYLTLKISKCRLVRLWLD